MPPVEVSQNPIAINPIYQTYVVELIALAHCCQLQELIFNVAAVCRLLSFWIPDLEAITLSLTPKWHFLIAYLIWDKEEN